MYSIYNICPNLQHLMGGLVVESVVAHDVVHALVVPLVVAHDRPRPQDHLVTVQDLDDVGVGRKGPQKPGQPVHVTAERLAHRPYLARVESHLGVDVGWRCCSLDDPVSLTTLLLLLDVVEEPRVEDERPEVEEVL